MEVKETSVETIIQRLFFLFGHYWSINSRLSLRLIFRIRERERARQDADGEMFILSQADMSRGRDRDGKLERWSLDKERE